MLAYLSWERSPNSCPNFLGQGLEAVRGFSLTWGDPAPSGPLPFYYLADFQVVFSPSAPRGPPWQTLSAQARFSGPYGCLGPVGHLQFIEDIGGVVAHGF